MDGRSVARVYVCFLPRQLSVFMFYAFFGIANVVILAFISLLSALGARSRRLEKKFDDIPTSHYSYKSSFMAIFAYAVFVDVAYFVFVYTGVRFVDYIINDII